MDWIYGTRTHHTNMDSYDRTSAEDLKQASIIMASFVLPYCYDGREADKEGIACSKPGSR
jgi:hypothetical protein